MTDIRSMRKIFLVGIGGIGMSALAVILKERGHMVSGSDRSESDTTRGLTEKGIEVLIGHSPENITGDIDAIVYTNAISPDNPEFLRAKELGIKQFERATMLDILAAPKFSIGISGTHGKTTTTSMVSKIFLNAGLDPTLAVGGHLNEIKGSGYEGKGKYFIYEACEAYSSFLKLHPVVALITNIDSDHLDHYGTMGNVKKAFDKYIRENIPPYGKLIYNADDHNLNQVVKKARPKNALSIGIKRKNADFVASDIILDEFSSTFKVHHHKKLLGEFSVNIPGRHNIYNAMLAIATAVIFNVPLTAITKTLSHFKNADRRFQLKFESEELLVIDDYAHHPSEIDATLNAARNLSDRKHAQLIAVFQPHLYSRTQFLYKEFAKSLSRADWIVLTDIYAAREKNINNISTMMIYDEVVKLKGQKNVIYSHELKEVPQMVKNILNGRNIVVTLGAGDVWKVSELLNPN